MDVPGWEHHWGSGGVEALDEGRASVERQPVELELAAADRPRHAVRVGRGDVFPRRTIGTAVEGDGAADLADRDVRLGRVPGPGRAGQLGATGDLLVLTAARARPDPDPDVVVRIEPEA